MYKLIQKVGDYHVLTSIQNHINLYNNQSKLIKNKTNKKHQEIYDRGCLYMDKTMKYPTIKSYSTVFKISDNVNVKDILNLFYTDKELRKRSVLQRPKIIKNYKTYVQSGGNSFRHLVASDPRRYVLTNTANSYVIKIARHKDYTCAYEDEAKIYTELQKKNTDDVVKMYGSGKIIDNTINNEKIIINEQDFEQLQLKSDEIKNAQYIILENTTDYKDFYDYINDLNSDKNKNNTIIQVLKVFHKIMETIKKYNNDGFFHGDLHGHNVKVKVNDSEINVKLFDFDFSGIINENNSIISRNITIYNLKKDQNLIFSCNKPSQNICECKTQFNKPSGIDDIKKFMYQFDYFRLLLSTIIHLENIFENSNNGQSVVNIIKQNVPQQEEDKEIFDKIIKWYETNVIPKWSFCFKNAYFCTNIWETSPNHVELKKIQNESQGPQMTSKDLVDHLNRLRLNPSSGDLSSNFSSMLSNQPGGKNSNTTKRKKLKKNIKDNNIKHTSNNR